MIGTVDADLSWLTISITTKPLLSGRPKSIRIRSGLRMAANWIADAVSCADKVVKPCAIRRTLMASIKSLSSSTIKIVLLAITPPFEIEQLFLLGLYAQDEISRLNLVDPSATYFNDYLICHPTAAYRFGLATSV